MIAKTEIKHATPSKVWEHLALIARETVTDYYSDLFYDALCINGYYRSGESFTFYWGVRTTGTIILPDEHGCKDLVLANANSDEAYRITVEVTNSRRHATIERIK